MLRDLTKNDITDLLEIENLTQESPWCAATFTRCFEMGYDAWGIEQGKIIIGFLIMSSTPVGENHLLNVCVHPDFQRQGLGTQLLNHALVEAKRRNSASIMYLEVRKTNLSAIKLYHRLGFVQISERKGYYPSKKGREDALIFAKDLGVLDS